MPRDIPVGNGRLLICFDQNYCLRDLYYPHVGQENHIGGHSSRLGVTGGDSPCGVEKITAQGRGQADKLLGGIS